MGLVGAGKLYTVFTVKGNKMKNKFRGFVNFFNFLVQMAFYALLIKLYRGPKWMREIKDSKMPKIFF